MNDSDPLWAQSLGSMSVGSGGHLTHNEGLAGRHPRDGDAAGCLRTPAAVWVCMERLSEAGASKVSFA